MSSPKYFVTYMLTTDEAGANPFWHSSLLMSEQSDENAEIEVKHAFGFYSSYPSSTTNPIINFLKNMLGFKIDLQDSHGHLETEKIRYMDGEGLRGISFEVSIEKYQQLLTDYQRAKQLEQEAIRDHTLSLLAKGLPVNGHTIWLEEQEWVRKSHAPRLFAFHIDWTLSLNCETFGLCISPEASTCKTRAVQFLVDAGIIDDRFVTDILGKHELPRWGKMDLPPLHFISSGERVREEKTGRDGQTKVYYNRSWENGNRLFWAHKPIIYDNESASIQTSPDQESEYRLIGHLLEKINDLEPLLLKKMEDHQTNERYYQQCETQIERLLQIKTLLHLNKHHQLDPHAAFKTLNVAQMTLTPEKINHTFLDRAIENIALQHALLGLISIVATASLMSGAAAIAITICATAYSGWQLYLAIQKELRIIEMMVDYTESLATQVLTQRTLSADGQDFLISRPH